MASARLTRALAEGQVKIQRAPRVGCEVMLAFRPLRNRETGQMEKLASISLSTFRPIEPLKRSGVTIEHLRNSNLDDLLRRQAVILV
jgi:hypothetical protein